MASCHGISPRRIVGVRQGMDWSSGAVIQQKVIHLHLPQMDGLETCRLLASSYPPRAEHRRHCSITLSITIVRHRVKEDETRAQDRCFSTVVQLGVDVCAYKSRLILTNSSAASPVVRVHTCHTSNENPVTRRHKVRNSP